MRNIWRIAIGLVLAHAAPVYAASSDEYADVHSVAVISAIGDTIALTNIGTTTFSQNEWPIADWKLDDAVAAIVTKAVVPRFAVKRVNVDTSALRALKPGLLTFLRLPDLKTYVLGLSATNDVDAYIVVHKLLWQDTCGGTHQNLWGLGLYHHDGLFYGQQQDGIYAYYAVDVIDARSGREIDQGIASLTPGGLFGNPPPPCQETSAVDWAETAESLTGQQRSEVKSALTAVVTTSLIYALRDAKLIATTSSAAVNANVP
jgi:hypothetical protein